MFRTGYSKPEARAVLASYFGVDAIEAICDTAQHLGEVTTYATSGHEVRVVDDGGCWFLYITASVTA